MSNKRRVKSIIAAVLCFVILFTELPVSQITSVGTAFAETVPEGEFREEKVEENLEDEEDSGEELLGSSESLSASPAIMVTLENNAQYWFPISAYPSGGYLKGLGDAIYYDAGKSTFTLKKGLKGNVKFEGGIKCTFDLCGQELTGAVDAPVIRVESGCDVTLTDSSGTGAGCISHSKLVRIDSAGLVFNNKGTVRIKNVRLGSASRTLQATLNGTGLYNNLGTAELENVEFRNLIAGMQGAAVWSKGVLTLKNITVDNCSSTSNGGVIFNAINNKAKTRVLQLAGRVSGKGTIVNDGVIRSTADPTLLNAVDLAVANSDTGIVESGVFANVITGGTTETGGGKVRLVFTVDGKKDLIQPGTQLQKRLKTLYPDVSVFLLPLDGGRKMTEDDKAEPENMKNRVIELEKDLTVSFETNWQETTVPDQTLKSGQCAKEPVLKREYYKGVVWYTDDAFTKKYDFTQPVWEDIKLYANWIRPEKVTVTFDSNGGSKVPAQTLWEGEKASLPAEPEKLQCVFTGWSDKNGAAYNFDQPVTEDITLTACWKKVYLRMSTVFSPQNGQPDFTRYFECGGKLTEPSAPVREGYIFTGWSENPSGTPKFDFTKTYVNVPRLYAGWKAKGKYTVTFDSMGGSPVASQTVYDQDTAVKPSPDPAKTAEGLSLRFCGWYLDEEATKPYDFSTPVTKNFTLYAGWLDPAVTVCSVSFETNGGGKIDPQTVSLGEKAVKPSDPVREAYIFGGWYSNAGCTKEYDFDAPVMQSLILYAKWTMLPAVPVRVFFERGDGTAPAVQTLLIYEKAVEPDVPVRQGFFFTGWYGDKGCTKRFDFNTRIEQDTTIYAGWKAKEKLVVSFDTDGGSKVDSQLVLAGDRVQKPADPTKSEGGKAYRFCGWYTQKTDGQKYDFSKPVEKSMTLYARWLLDPLKIVHVRYETDGGSAVPEEVLQAGTKAAKPEKPTKEGYVFGAWCTDKELQNEYDFAADVTEDIVLYARWIEIPVTSFKVTFKYKNETSDKEVTVIAGCPVEQPSDPTWKGYFFEGWYSDEKCTKLWDFRNKIWENTTLYARWRMKEEYQITFNSMGGSTVQSQKVLEQEKAEKPSPDPEKTVEGVVQKFCGWCVDEKCTQLYDFNTPVTKHLTLYARWLNPSIIPVTVIYNANGGYFGDDPQSGVLYQTLQKDDKAVKPADPKKSPYVFTGWYSDEGCTKKYDFNTPVKEDITLTAGWNLAPAVAVHVYFELGDGSTPSVQTVLMGDLAAEPEEPERREYFFTGWYADSSCAKRFDFAVPVLTDTTVYAGWRKKETYTVSFNSLGGSTVAAKNVLEMDPVEKPADPTKENCIFCGWCKDPECRYAYNFEKPVGGDMTLYARWLQKAVIPVHVTFETGGGSPVPEEIIAKGDQVHRPEDPTRKQHVFLGWFTDKELVQPYDFEQAVDEDLKLYASWELAPVIPIRVTFDYQNGTEAETITVMSGQPVEEPVEPLERKEYFFTGWYSDKACTSRWDFRNDVLDSCTFYAGWRKKEEYTVSFDSLGGSEVASQTVLELNGAVKPDPDPTKTEGTVTYEFCGWCLDENGVWLYQFGLPVTEDLQLYARWLTPGIKPVTVTFNANGGNFEEENWNDMKYQTLVQGDKATKPENPVRTPYVFTGWYLDKSCTQKYDFNTSVMGSIELFAGWNLVPVIMVHVTFETGGGVAPIVQTIPQYGTPEVPEDPARRTDFFIGWYADKSCTKRFDFTQPVEEDITVYAGWNPKKPVTVTFDTLGGTPVPEPADLLEQDLVPEPEAPTKDGCIFCGWCSDRECHNTYNFGRPVAKSMTLYARWLQKSVVAVRVSYETFGGSDVMTEVLAKGDKAHKPADPVMDYYTFTGWYADADYKVPYDFGTPVKEDTTLYAKWLFDPVMVVHVTFEYKNGDPAETEILALGDPVEEPEEPVYENHYFMGWFSDEGCTRLWNFKDRICQDTTLYAGWRARKTFTVTFDSNRKEGETGTDISEPKQKVRELDRVVKPEDQPTRKADDLDYIFCGWSEEKDSVWLYDFSQRVTEDLILYAVWLEPSMHPVKVEFDSAGGSSVKMQVVASGSTAKRPEKPKKTGCSFVDWLKDGFEYLFETTPVVEDIKLTAKWLAQVVVPVWLYFDTQGGSSIEPVLVASGSNAVKPEKDPEKAGSNFTGWFEDPECTTEYDFDSILTQDRIIYAGWSEKAVYTFRFESNGGTPVESQRIMSGNLAREPEAPTREGYRFMFWCEDKDFRQVYDFTQPVLADTTVYARWMSKDLDCVTVHFETNGGSAVADQSVPRGDRASRPVDPGRSYYRFTGWYIDAGCQNAYDFDTPVTEDLTLYAGWSYTGGGGGSSAGSSKKTMDAYDTAGKLYGVWTQDTKGWWIKKPDGSWPRGEWVQCTWQGVLNWYYFTEEGYMASGFIKDKDGNTYYLHTAATGSCGAMATGWVQIEENWYYFNTVSDGTKGAMLKNTVTPDGYRVGANGIWNGKPKK